MDFNAMSPSIRVLLTPLSPPHPSFGQTMKQCFSLSLVLLVYVFDLDQSLPLAYTQFFLQEHHPFLLIFASLHRFFLALKFHSYPQYPRTHARTHLVSNLQQLHPPRCPYYAPVTTYQHSLPLLFLYFSLPQLQQYYSPSQVSISLTH